MTPECNGRTADRPGLRRASDSPKATPGCPTTGGHAPGPTPPGGRRWPPEGEWRDHDTGGSPGDQVDV